jgi:hypothetical protein
VDNRQKSRITGELRKTSKKILNIPLFNYISMVKVGWEGGAPAGGKGYYPLHQWRRKKSHESVNFTAFKKGILAQLSPHLHPLLPQIFLNMTSLSPPPPSTPPPPIKNMYFYQEVTAEFSLLISFRDHFRKRLKMFSDVLRIRHG